MSAYDKNKQGLIDAITAAHTVTPANPENVTVNLFDYWVEDSGKSPTVARDGDILQKSDWHIRPNADDKGNIIENGKPGAGESTQYGNAYAGMEGIVKNVLNNGCPEINLAAAEYQLTEDPTNRRDPSDPEYRDYTKVRDYQPADFFFRLLDLPTQDSQFLRQIHGRLWRV